MAIIVFWSGSEKETGQTLAISALGGYMGVNHNYKLLLVDATFHDDTMARCFWNVHNEGGSKALRKLAGSKMDISSGAEGLVSAVASNQVTPEIITNYTKPIFSGGKFDVLAGLKTSSLNEYTKSMMLYKDVLNIANKYYDMVLVDLQKTLKMDTTKALLKQANVIVYTLSQNERQLEEYVQTMIQDNECISKEKVVPLIANCDEFCKYNAKNISSRIRERRVIPSVIYHPQFKERACEAGVSDYFTHLALRTQVKDDLDGRFLKALGYLDQRIDEKLEELKLKV